MARLPQRAVRRRVTGGDQSLFRYERALQRSGFLAIAGVDEAGRGACAGPLVVGAAVLDVTSRKVANSLAELGDSKQLTAATRDRVYDRITTHALAWSTVVVPAEEVDRIGLHVANIEGMRRALARLNTDFDYVLSDGFAVPGLATPNLGVWKGDQVCGCVAAAGVLAKVTRDRIMIDLDTRWPQYGFGIHKGYVTSMTHWLSLDPRLCIGSRLRRCVRRRNFTASLPAQVASQRPGLRRTSFGRALHEHGRS